MFVGPPTLTAGNSLDTLMMLPYFLAHSFRSGLASRRMAVLPRSSGGVPALPAIASLPDRPDSGLYGEHQTPPQLVPSEKLKMRSRMTRNGGSVSHAGIRRSPSRGTTARRFSLLEWGQSAPGGAGGCSVSPTEAVNRGGPLSPRGKSFVARLGGRVSSPYSRLDSRLADAFASHALSHPLFFILPLLARTPAVRPNAHSIFQPGPAGGLS